jgi:hypothetical protein
LVRFGDGKHRFYLESVCGNPVVKGKLCINCDHLLPQTKTQDVKTFPHGLVLEDYSDYSHIFDSLWYHKKVKTYGPPSKEDIELAMEAQKRARAGKRTKTIKELLESLGGAIMVKEKEKTKVKKIKKISTTPMSTPITTTDTNVLEKMIPLTALYVESMDDSIEVNEVVTVVLKKDVIDGQQVWKETDGTCVYEYLGPSKKGALINE